MLALAPARPLVPRAQRPRRRLVTESGLSLGLHALLLALLILSVTTKPLNDEASEPGVAVVFEGGPKVSTPQTQESRRSSPGTAPDERSTSNDTGGAGAPTPPAPASQQSQPQPKPSEAQPAETQPAQSMPAIAPQSVAPALPNGAELAPPPGLVEHPPTPAHVTSQHVTPRHQARAAAPANPFASLASPGSFSLTGRAPPPASAGHLTRGLLLTMAPNDHNRNVMTRYADMRRKLGEDWWNQFNAFVEAHKYFPASAAEAGQEGVVGVHLWINRDGTVANVKVNTSTGYPALDAAWISLFRGNKMPPFPPGTIDDQTDFDATMTFIILHE